MNANALWKTLTTPVTGTCEVTATLPNGKTLRTETAFCVGYACNHKAHLNPCLYTVGRELAEILQTEIRITFNGAPVWHAQPLAEISQ